MKYQGSIYQLTNGKLYNVGVMIVEAKNEEGAAEKISEALFTVYGVMVASVKRCYPLEEYKKKQKEK